MRNKILLTALFWTVILGSVLISWSWITGETLQVVVSRVEIANGIYMYKIDLLGYIKNLQNTLNTITTLGATPPPKPTYNWTDYLNAFKTIGKVFFYAINWIIYIIQIIVFVPMKFIIYLIVVTLSMLGMNGSSIMEQVNRIYLINIPYLQYSWLG